MEFYMATFKKLTITLGLLFCFDLLATEPKKSIDSPTTRLMDQLLSELIALKKFMISEDKFADPKNASEISAHLKAFAKIAKDAGHDPALNKVNFKFSRQILENHIAETERIFRIGIKSYARAQLAATVSVCMSCHTQSPASSVSFKDFNNFKTFTSELDQAEFLFAIQSYDKAMELYNKIIDEYPKNNYNPHQIETSFERQLTYLSRIKRQPQQAISLLKTRLKNKELPEYLQRNIAAWISQFEKWENTPFIDPKSATDKQIVEFAKKNIETKWTAKAMDATNPELVTYLRISGALFEYLQTYPKSKVVPEILYWLAICDRSIDNNFYFSLADLYLRECITQYSKSPVAKRCYKEFKDQIIFGYTGSRGTDVPPEVKRDLDELKRLLESGDHIEILDK